MSYKLLEQPIKVTIFYGKMNQVFLLLLLKSSMHSKQWYLFCRKGSGKPSNNIEIANATGESFTFETSLLPQVGLYFKNVSRIHAHLEIKPENQSGKGQQV